MNSDKYIVITSINPPTDAVRKFASWDGWTVVVVGDRKSPRDWNCDGVEYLSMERQRELFPVFAEMIPENTYVRKILGYLFAIKHGARAIFESDDDNLPYPDARTTAEADLARPASGSTLKSNGGWLNIYPQFGAPECWPRGFPLRAITDPAMTAFPADENLPWGILQYLADDDPDVDAIYRMTRGQRVYFARDRSYRVARGAFGPFNSQATLWRADFFPLMFLPLGVTDRVTDILRGYIALACLWRLNHTLQYSSPVVYQLRNEHNLLKDFEHEIELYRRAEKWCEQLMSVSGNTPAQLYLAALQMLVEDGSISQKNIAAYELFARCIAGEQCG